MKIKCHNGSCGTIFEYNGNDSWTDCPNCSSKIPINLNENNSSSTILENNSNSFRNNLRFWLLEHPKINPFNYFIDSVEFKKNAGSRKNPNNPFLRLTGSIRTLPDFIVIGGTRSGGMTLTKYIQEHPSVYVSRNVHFFEFIASNNVNWYKRHFPSYIYKKKFLRKNKQKLVVGESTGTYLFHPDIPKRIKNILPNVKLIVMLRNPVVSSYSKYNHYKNEGLELNSFEDAIKMEIKRIDILKQNNELKSNNPDFNNNVNFHYLRHGHYAEKLKNWLKVFPRNQIHMVVNDEFNADLDKTVEETFSFLGLPNHKTKNRIKHSVGKYPKLQESTKEFLIDYFKPHNEELYEILGRKLPWENI